MAQGGAKPKPADLSIVGGSSYVDKKTAEKIKKRPKPDKFPFKIPPKQNARVKKYWLDYEKHLAPRGTWGEGDRDGLLELCVVKDACLEMKKTIDAEGYLVTVTNAQGYENQKLNPLWNSYQKLHSRWLNLLYEYGLTPLGRIKLGISPDGGGPLDEIEDEDSAAKYF